MMRRKRNWWPTKLGVYTTASVLLWGCTNATLPDWARGGEDGGPPQGDAGERADGSDGTVADGAVDGATDADVTADAGDASADGGWCCDHRPRGCGHGEDAFDSMEACEAAGPGCYARYECCEPVFCRASECPGRRVEDRADCEPDGYCFDLPSGELCTGAMRECHTGGAMVPDQPCPEGYTCTHFEDGSRCVVRRFADAQACEDAGAVAIRAEFWLACDSMARVLGNIDEPEYSMCCLHDVVPGAECSAWDVQGVGDCEQLLGWAWDGETPFCLGVGGCECEGEDCDRLYDDEVECIDGLQEEGCLEPDCRVIGCEYGQECSWCEFSYVCLEEGATC